MSEERLKKCPFCGGEAAVMRDSFQKENLCNVYCMNCYASSPICKLQSAAENAWNTRYEVAVCTPEELENINVYQQASLNFIRASFPTLPDKFKKE